MKPIILIGYMGSGKSAIGRALSADLKLPFFDTDEMIESSEGISINEIFATKGEEYFRNLETSLLEDLVKKSKEDIILSTGGGMPIRKENAELLNRLGMVFYLNAKPETIYERVKHDTTRPLLKCENPKEKIDSMIKERGPKYEACAYFKISVDEKSILDIVGEIKNEITSY